MKASVFVMVLAMTFLFIIFFNCHWARSIKSTLVVIDHELKKS